MISRYTEEGDERKRPCSVFAVARKENKNILIGYIALSQTHGQIALDRAYRISSIKRHHLKKLDTAFRESVMKHRKWVTGKTDVALLILKWLQAPLKSEPKVFRA